MEQGAQRAATSCSGQTYTFIRITDVTRKRRIASICKDSRILNEAPLVYVVCADLHRLDKLVKIAGSNCKLGAVSGSMIGAIDAALASQNLVLLAENLGYGTAYVGTCGDVADELIAELELPERVMPVFGIAIGKPAEKPPIRPRLPRSIIFHENRYQEFSEDILESGIQHMSEQLDKEGYYKKYSNRENYSWKNHLARKFGGTWLVRVENDRKIILDKHMKSFL